MTRDFPNANLKNFVADLHCYYMLYGFLPRVGGRDGTVVRALPSHQCDLGSIPGLGVICGLSLLLILVLAPRGFSPGTPVFPSPQKPTLLNSNSILKVSPISALR